MIGKQAGPRARGGATPGARPDAAFEWRINAPRSNADLAYERLRHAIVAGQFEPGQRITEVGIATLLGISRTPVREAFFRLETAGLLRSRSAGVEVVDPRGEADDIHLLREAVEGCAARLAAQRATPAEIKTILDLAIRTGEADPADLSVRAALNEQFHLAIAEASHAPRVERLIREYRSLFATPAQLERIPGPETKQLLQDHAAIADAISGGMPELAEKRIRNHLRRFHPPAA